jgi:hypothetical protein
MNFKLAVVILVAFVGAALCAPSAPAQGRSIRGASAPSGRRSSVRGTGRAGLARPGQRRYLNDSGFLYPAYFYPYDDYDFASYGPEENPIQYVPVQATAPAPAPAVPAAPPSEAMVLENHGGQWVRVPNGGMAPSAAPSGKSDSSHATPNPHPGIVDPAAGTKPAPVLPAAVIVFRDGHKEELQKYMIQGDALYTSETPYNPGALTKRIPLDQLDIPASLKLNQDRGAKFNLPTASNEVMIRF